MTQQVVLITGGTGAIGTALCREFAKQDFTIVTNCHPSDQARSEAVVTELVAEGVNVQLSAFDVTDAESCEVAIAKIENTIGPISTVINAAGITRCQARQTGYKTVG